MKASMQRFVITFVLILVSVVSEGLVAQAQLCTGPGTGTEPFSSLQTGFSQQLFATSGAYGGVAFAPNGDLWTDLGPNIFFPSTPSLLFRFSLSSTVVVNSTTIHPQVPGSPFTTDVGTGLTNGFGGNLYSNTVSGVVMLDPNTGSLLAGPFGPKGSGLGIATDPQTGNLVYVGADDSTLFFVDPAFTKSGTFSTAAAGTFLDGIYFDPTGNFLFVAGSAFFVGGVFQSGLGVVNRQGNLVQAIPNPGGVVGSFCVGPDGVAFHTAPTFVVSNNRDGTMTRYDFPNGDFTQPPTLSTLASGGFRGDFTQVGPDNCLYVTQLGTRFSDSTLSFDPSVVRICPDFVPPPGVKPPTCPIGGGGWKNKPTSWPTTSLPLGAVTYTQTELLGILRTPVRGDASLILADQLIPAKLSIENGSNPLPIVATITDADNLLAAFSGPLPYSIPPSSATGTKMVNDANVLQAYNAGLLTPSNCP